MGLRKLKTKCSDETQDPLVKPDLVYWAYALKKAEEELEVDLEGEDLKKWVFDESFRQELIKSRAEALCMEDGRVPFHWRHAVNCKQCGWMPSYAPIKEEVTSCPWCHTKYGGMRKHWENDPEFLEFEASQSKLRRDEL